MKAEDPSFWPYAFLAHLSLLLCSIVAGILTQPFPGRDAARGTGLFRKLWDPYCFLSSLLLQRAALTPLTQAGGSPYGLKLFSPPSAVLEQVSCSLVVAKASRPLWVQANHGFLCNMTPGSTSSSGLPQTTYLSSSLPPPRDPGQMYHHRGYY